MTEPNLSDVRASFNPANGGSVNRTIASGSVPFYCECPRQLEELITVGEEVTGRKFDVDRPRAILERSNQAIDGWVQVLNAGKLTPSPYDAFSEGVSFMAPINVLRGTPEAVEFYRVVNEELAERIALGITPLPEERFRVVMDGTARLQRAVPALGGWSSSRRPTPRSAASSR